METLYSFDTAEEIEISTGDTTIFLRRLGTGSALLFMTFLRIVQFHPYLERIKIWHEDAFPVDERRSFDELTALLSHPEMYLCALVNNEQLVGFIIYWQWTDLLFVEHIAIDPEQRGKQFGQKALTLLADTRSPCFLLEVERPTDEISRRRIQFYERQGFILNMFDYVQPAYQPGKVAVPMRLMSIPAIKDVNDFNRLSTFIKHQIYERFYQ